ncbi:MAG: TIR domain-containing protein [Pseudomonadota bacterium]
MTAATGEDDPDPASDSGEGAGETKPKAEGQKPERHAGPSEADLRRIYRGPPPQDLEDVARLLKVSRKSLAYALFKAPDENRYATWEIPKRSGGMRRIDAPLGVIRRAQRALAPILIELHRPHPASHGFLAGRSILSNAEAHVGQRLVLNVDLEEFFPSINFGRVRGLFRSAPFQMGDAAATVCAQLCTFRNGLPQGAPTSPILSNYIASGLDRRLQRLARQNRARYSRYADDITFSTGAAAFPVSLCRPSEAARPAEGEEAAARPANAPVAVGPELAAAISAAGFSVNAKKVRLQRRHVRQSVTGVTVNEKPNVDRRRVRRIRAMIHAWRKFGLDAAGEAHWRLRGFQKGPGGNAKARVFRNALYGELAYLKMLRGEQDAIYRGFAGQLMELDPNPPKSLRRQIFGADDFEVFISHASEDKAEIARPIWEACERRGIKAFLDQVDITAGERFTEKINVALGAARVVLAVITPTSVTKEWPLAEINTALGLEVDGEKTVYAVVAGRPDLQRLPLIRQKKYHVWRGDAEAVAAELAALLSGEAPREEPAAADAEMAASAAPRVARTASPAEPAPKRRGGLIGWLRRNRR